MPSLMEELIFGLKADENILDLYLNEIANNGLLTYKDIVQYGAKDGQRLYNHVLDGIFCLNGIKDIVPINDIELKVLMTAYSVHDINKLSEYKGMSTNKAATAQNIKAELKRIHIENFFPEYEMYFDDIKTIVRAHSASYNNAGERLFNDTKYQLGKERLDELILIVQAVDLLDISRDITEKKFKEEFLWRLNSVSSKHYRLEKHIISENRGILTNLIHNKIIEHMKENYDAVPLVYYPEGVVYLIEKDKEINFGESDVYSIANSCVEEINNKIGRDFKSFINKSGQGIKVDKKCLEMGISFKDIFDYIDELIIGGKSANADNINEKSLNNLEKYKKKIQDDIDKTNIKIEKLKDNDKKTDKIKELNENMKNYREELKMINEIEDNRLYIVKDDDDILKLSELLRTYYIFLNSHILLDSEKSWDYIYNLFDLDNKRLRLKPFDVLYQRPYILGQMLYPEYKYEDIKRIVVSDGETLTKKDSYESGEFEILKDYIINNLVFSFYQRKAIKLDLNAYSKNNHRQCCLCSSGYEASEWMSSDVPKGMKVQQFSNRLGAGKRDPKRHVCPVCKYQYILNKLVFESGDYPLYIHIFPDSYFAPEFINSYRNAIMDYRNKDIDSLFLNMNQIIKDYKNNGFVQLKYLPKKSNGYVVPRYPELETTVITSQVQLSDKGVKQFLFALEYLLLYKKYFGFKMVLSDMPICEIKKDEFDDVYISSIPVSLKKWIGTNNIKTDKFNSLFEEFSLLYNISSNLNYDKLISYIETYAEGNLDFIYEIYKDIKNVDERHRYLKLKNIMPSIDNLLNLRREDNALQIKELSKIASDYHLWGSKSGKWTENALAKPLNVVFDKVYSFNEKKETIDELKAICKYELEKSIKRIYEKFGAKKAEGVERFVDSFIDNILIKLYNGNVIELNKDKKRILAAYLYFLNQILSNKNEEDIDDENA